MIDSFNTHRPLLFGIAYRMLGRVSEAEDIVQEAWLRWQKQDGSSIQSAKAWLVAATTRLCIDQLRSARHQRETYYGIWLPEPLMPTTDSDPSQASELADSLSMAFMLMLDTLKPADRAVYLLREVFSYDYPDIATIVGKSVANCRQIVSRAKSLLQVAPRTEAQPSERARQLVAVFLAAAADGDMQGVLRLLADDSRVLSDGGGRVKAIGRIILGADRVSRFLLGIWPHFISAANPPLLTLNGSPGFIVSNAGRVDYVLSFEVADNRIQAIYIVCNPDKLRHIPAPENTGER